jgi:ATP-dependent protease HslVU (ClpYQ) ATPase subunit
MKEKKITITRAHVIEKLGEFLEKDDLSRYIL